jgi:CBS domain containing-hemolysin-like protein
LGEKCVVKKNTKKSNSFSNKKWIIIIIIWTLIIGGGTSLLSDMLLSKASLLVAFVILIVIVFIGVVFDTIGTAVTAANEVPFHAMAAKKIKGAKTAVNLIRNADKVSNFCNDVIGDICGIVSGAAGTLIVGKIILSLPNAGGNIKMNVFSALIGALIAATTIGGKAVGKIIAIKKSNDIIFEVAKLIHLVKKDR